MYINEFTNYLSDKIDDIVALTSGMLENDRDIEEYPLEYDYLFHLGSLLNNASDIVYRERDIKVRFRNIIMVFLQIYKIPFLKEA